MGRAEVHRPVEVRTAADRGHQEQHDPDAQRRDAEILPERMAGDRRPEHGHDKGENNSDRHSENESDQLAYDPHGYEFLIALNRMTVTAWAPLTSRL